MKKIYYFGHINKTANDGGKSRNSAFLRAFEEIGAVIVNVYSNNKLLRFFYLLNSIKILISSSNNKIFIHQGTLISAFPLSVIKYKIPFWIAFKILEKAIRSNDVTIEVNDLPYEQSIDLELPVNYVSKLFQNKLYSFDSAKYVFASRTMAEFVKNEFNVNFDVVLNGSVDTCVPENDFSSNFPTSTEKKFVYAGSLSKGRQIEDLISKFRGKKSLLILIGESGQWLKQTDLPENIFYLGEFPENQACTIVAKCDIGIIPYSAERFYYNICYPTKASFYIAAGIPFLSTPLAELMRVFNGSGMAHFLEFNKWEDFIGAPASMDFQEMKIRISKRKHEFYWRNLLDLYIRKFYVPE